MANDYFDYIRGADTIDRIGPERLVASGRIPPLAMRRMAIGLFLLAFLVGLSMVAYRGSEMLVVGIAAIVFGYSYTGGPYPLAYHGLGDVFVVVFFGLVATMGTFYVITGELSFAVLLLGLPLGLLANNILVVNNYRDKETDEAAGKLTLVVRLGRRFARQQYGWQLALAYLCVSAYAGINRSFWPLVSLVTIPVGAQLIVELRSRRGSSERALGQVGQTAADVQRLAGLGDRHFLVSITQSFTGIRMGGLTIPSQPSFGSFKFTAD